MGNMQILVGELELYMTSHLSLSFSPSLYVYMYIYMCVYMYVYISVMSPTAAVHAFFLTLALPY